MLMCATEKVIATRTIIAPANCIGLARFVKQRVLFLVAMALTVKTPPCAIIKTVLASIQTNVFAMLIIMVQHVKLLIALESYPILA